MGLFTDTTLSIVLSSFLIPKVVKLRPKSFKINSLVYYESTHQTLEGIPDVEFKSGNTIIDRTNSLGQSKLIFEALPGDKISIKFPQDRGYSLIDTSIILNKGQNSLNINVTRDPVEINLISIDSLSGEKITEIDTLELIVNNYSIRAKKIDDKFTVITNIFDPEDELKINLSSQKYENLRESIKVKQIDINLYEGTFYVKPKEENYFVKDIKREPGEGILILDSEPKEARIYINDVEENNTPDTLTLFEGFHTIELKKEGYLSPRVVIAIKPDSIIKKNIKLEGPIAPLQKISSWLKISTDLTFLGLLMEYPRGNVYLFPTFRLGSHFFPLYNSDCGLKVSYLASKVPAYYTSQQFGMGLFFGKKRFHWLIGINESNFESFKKIDARFAGSSAETYFTICFDSEDRAKERLLFLNQYSNAIFFGYEKSFKSMNKSIEGKFKKEQEFYIGYMRRLKRGNLNFRFGVIDPKLTVIDIEEKKHKIIDIRISRLFISYNYFLN
ncbi:MAG: PEGA domain-containing protein [Candidatus Hodarchaeota archaeon]